ncbi:STL1 [Scenedesmus sp. PABB004]|nr:STL1 [Scenedesmus sp. PABB004]
MKRSGAVLAAIAAAAVVAYAALIVSTACPRSSELPASQAPPAPPPQAPAASISARSSAAGAGGDGECADGFLRVSRRRFWEYNAGLRDPRDAWPGLSEVIVAQDRVYAVMNNKIHPNPAHQWVRDGVWSITFDEVGTTARARSLGLDGHGHTFIIHAQLPAELQERHDPAAPLHVSIGVELHGNDSGANTATRRYERVPYCLYPPGAPPFRHLVACTMVRQSAVRLVPEWVAYHALQGVQHFFIYVDDPPGPAEEALRPLVQAGLVTVVDFDWPPELAGSWAFQQAEQCGCLVRHRGRARWVALTDVDEYLQVTDGTNTTVAEWLAARSHMEHLGAFQVKGMYLGSSANATQQAAADAAGGGLQLATFTAGPSRIDGDKLLARPESVNYMSVHLITGGGAQHNPDPRTELRVVHYKDPTNRKYNELVDLSMAAHAPAVASLLARLNSSALRRRQGQRRGLHGGGVGHVRGIPGTTTCEQLAALFESCGPITNVLVVLSRTHETNTAYVDFAQEASAQKVLVDYKTRPLVLGAVSVSVLPKIPKVVRMSMVAAGAGGRGRGGGEFRRSGSAGAFGGRGGQQRERDGRAQQAQAAAAGQRLVLSLGLAALAWLAYNVASVASVGRFGAFGAGGGAPSRPPAVSDHHDSRAPAVRWVVMTTISHPMDAVRKLAALDGWRVVVVADKKTPADWTHPNVTFLSVEQQRWLGYKILSHIPWNNYGRKNIGYLYAIANGATAIYETDDNNVLLTPTILQLVSPPDGGGAPELSPDVSGACPRAPFAMLDPGCDVDFNPYPLFGMDAWPRGLPLTAIKRPPATCFSRRPGRPLIQQGLANKDPDVDAIVRLQRDLNVVFDEQAFSVLLPPGSMSPFNSQNTLFAYDALWALLLPVSTSMRVCDIWRGYWAQRLLWDVGGHLAFVPPTVVKQRNPHTIFKDFLEEADLYSKAGALVADLRAWRPRAPDLPGRLLEVGRLLSAKGYWGDRDAKLMAAWVQDLRRVGYKFPSLVPASHAAADTGRTATGGNGVDGASHSANAPAAPPRSSSSGGAWPRSSFVLPRRWCRLDDVVLVVFFNSLRLNQGEGDSLHLMRLLHAAYKPWFGRVVFVGNWLAGPATGGPGTAPAPGPPPPNFLECDHLNTFLTGRVWWQFAYICLAQAMQAESGAGRRARGFLYINDDVMLSPCLLLGLNRSKVWYDSDAVTSHAAAVRWMEAHDPGGTHNVTNVLASHGWHWQADFSFGRAPGTLKNHTNAALANAYGWVAAQIQRRLGDEGQGGRFFGAAQADYYYVPARFARRFVTLAQHMRSYHVLSEAALPTMLGLLGDAPSDYEVVRGAMLWDGRRGAAERCVRELLPLGRSMDQRVADELDGCKLGVAVQGDLREEKPMLWLHPLKLSNRTLRQHSVAWWASQDCAGLPHGVPPPGCAVGGEGRGR